MGCVSSKQFKKEVQRDIILNNGRGEGGVGRGGRRINHVVSLTSSTYGALNLDKDKTSPLNNSNSYSYTSPTKQQQQPITMEKPLVEEKSPIREEKPLEVINTWELMGDLEEEGGEQAINNDNDNNNNQPQQKKRSPKTKVFLEARSPLKFLNQIGSPRKARTYGGKENKFKRASDFSPRPVFKANEPSGKSIKAVMRLSYSSIGKGSPSPSLNGVGKKDSFSSESSRGTLTSSSSSSGRMKRMSLTPLFDPELVALYEKELTEEEEQIKRIISLTPWKGRRLKHSREMELLLKSFELKCPPGGENSVVIYTTTLHGIRKTFEDCNIVRSIIESHCVRIIERDVSMDSGFKEEVRRLMGTKEVKVPLMFVKGRLIGGADQVVKLEEEGKLEILFDGIPRVVPGGGGCEGCAGVRFMMCRGCNGSTKVLDEAQRKMVKCGECNENGLVQCPICC